MSQINELKELRAKELHDAKAIIEKVKGESRDLSNDESAAVDAHYAEFDKLGDRIGTLERQSKLEQAESELRQAVRKTAPNSLRTLEDKGDFGRAVRSWFLTGTDRYRPSLDDSDNAQRCGLDLNSKRVSLRTMTTGASTAGTGLVQWREFTDVYERYLKYFGAVTNLVTVLPTDTGVTMPIPVFDDTSNAGRWLGENTTATITSPTISNVNLNAWVVSADQIPVSLELLQDSQTALEQLLPMMIAERIGRQLNAAVTNGDGSSKPRGILLDATASGVVASGTGASPTVSIDNLLDLKYSVDPAYRAAPSGKKGYLVTDRVLAQIRKAKDGQNRYFSDPFATGPGTLDGEAIFVNQDVPATGVNAKIAAYGDFSRYLLRQVMDVQFQRLDEIQALNRMVVFTAFARYDGRLLNPNAVKTLAAPAA